MHSNLIKSIHTVISFLLWKTLGTFLPHLPGFGLPKIGISTSTDFLFYWAENYSIHPQVFPWDMAFILESRLQESEISNSSGRVKRTPRGQPGSHSLCTCAYYLNNNSLWTSVSPSKKCSSDSHPVLRCHVRITCMYDEPSLKAAKDRMVIL